MCRRLHADLLLPVVLVPELQRRRLGEGLRLHSGQLFIRAYQLTGRRAVVKLRRQLVEFRKRPVALRQHGGVAVQPTILASRNPQLRGGPDGFVEVGDFPGQRQKAESPDLDCPQHLHGVPDIPAHAGDERQRQQGGEHDEPDGQRILGIDLVRA